jgi:uncharacterized protein YcaQ
LITLPRLRSFAVARSLFAPTTLGRALDCFGFVQADPIRAPARAQDLTLRHRVTGYRAGDLERLYPKLGIDEDVFLTYGFVTRSIQALMHPRSTRGVFADPGVRWSRARKAQAQQLLEFVRDRGAVHPREVVAHFSPRSVRNYWGGSSNATTMLLAGMHYRGLLRIQRRDAGIRVYALQQQWDEPADAEAVRARVDALARAAIHIYAPVTAKGLTQLVRRLRYAAPQWRNELAGAIQRAKDGHAHERVDGVEWYWPPDEDPDHHPVPDTVRLLAPFDPVVWDRDRLELLWGWAYRFEAYVPAPRRRFGYYALPLLWRDRLVGWGNLSVPNGKLVPQIHFLEPRRRRDAAFTREVDAELERMRVFLGVE